MAKNKFSRSQKDADQDLVKKFSRALQEDETVALPKPTANPLDVHDEENKEQENRNMPEWDFESFLGTDTMPDLDFPELTALDFRSDDLEFSERFEPIPPTCEPEENEAPKNAEIPPVKRITPGRKQSSGSGKRIAIALVSLVAAAGLGLGGLSLYQNFSDPYNHVILNGVTAGGIELGGMTKEQAEQALSAAVDPILSREDMVIILPDQTLRLSPAATKISLKADEAVREAYKYGRTGSKEQKEEDYRSSLSEVHEIDLLPYLEADENYILRLLEGYTDSHDSTFIPSSYALEGEQPPLDFENFNENNTPQTLLLILGSPGLHLEPQDALAGIMEAYSNLDMEPDLNLHSGDSAPESLDLNRVFEEYNIEPVNSSMDPDSFDVIPGSYGYTFDLQKARRMLDDAHYGDTIRIPMEYVTPDVLEDEVFFRDVLSTVSTPHGTNKKRNENLRLACKAINGLVLNPGDEFSYNATLGQRTAEKGYQAAPAYSGDQLVDSLGGGICQVSSTLYYSCLLADLEITDRISHGFLPSYIDPGMDATVSWGEPDFKFRNNSDFPIQIQAETTDEKVIIKILGTDNRDYYVKMEYEMSNIAPNEVHEQHDADSGYYDGQVLNEGSLGHYVKSYRCKYSKKTNTLISRELEAHSSYKSRNRVIADVKSKETQPIPDETLPPETKPGESMPPETKPSETTPQESIPPETKPSETTPQESIPPETQTPETVPPETQSPSETQAPPESVPSESQNPAV